MAADGRFAVVIRRFVVGDRYRSHLWLVPLDPRGRPRQLTSGSVRDSWPRISPDGRWIAFRRAMASGSGPTGQQGRPGARSRAGSDDSRVMVLRLGPRTAGVPRALRTPPGRAVSELAWDPSGQQLALAMEDKPARFIVGPEPPLDEEPLARRITRIDWRYDETGHLDRRTQLFVIDVAVAGRPIRLTEADWDVSDIAWSPDGARIAFAADPRPDADLRPRRSIWTVHVAPGQPRRSRAADRGACACRRRPRAGMVARWSVARGRRRGGARCDR